MSLQLSVAVRNARLDAIETAVGASGAVLEIRTGAPPANCAAGNLGFALVTINLPTNWLAAATGGQKSLAGVWQELIADNNGVAAHFRVYSAGGVCHMQGTVTLTGGGGDMTLDNTGIEAGQAVNIIGFTLTDGNA